MAAKFVNIDHDTPLLLPPDLRDWVGPDHMVHFIMDAVAYDLRVLIELTYTRFPESTEPLLNVFLELDQVAESKEDLSFLRGVRKSQAMVAAARASSRRNLVRRAAWGSAGACLVELGIWVPRWA